MKLIKKIMEIILRRESKKIIKNYNQYMKQRQITPAETMEALRSVYTDEMVDEKLKALNECIKTISKAKNPSIVLDRYEYGLQNAYTLRQLEDAGLYNENPTATEYINEFTKNKNKYIKEALERAQSIENDKTEEVYLYRKMTYFTESEEEEYNQFLVINENKLSELTESFYEVWHEPPAKDVSIEEKLQHLTKSLNRLYILRDFCKGMGRGGEVYYIKSWEELFNSKNLCFSQEQVILKKIEGLYKQKEKLDSLERYSNKIVKIINQEEVIYQKDLYKIFPEIDRQEIKDIVNELTAKSVIVKNKKGNSYELKIKK